MSRSQGQQGTPRARTLIRQDQLPLYFGSGVCADSITCARRKIGKRRSRFGLCGRTTGPIHIVPLSFTDSPSLLQPTVSYGTAGAQLPTTLLRCLILYSPCMACAGRAFSTLSLARCTSAAAHAATLPPLRMHATYMPYACQPPTITSESFSELFPCCSFPTPTLFCHRVNRAPAYIVLAACSHGLVTSATFLVTLPILPAYA